MAFWRSRGWLLSLASGYVLFLGILISETVFTLHQNSNPNDPGLAAELFRAGWLPWCRAFPPTRWFIEGPCEHSRLVSLCLFMPAIALLAVGYLGALRVVQRSADAWPLPRLLRYAGLAALPLLFMVPVTSGDYIAYLLAGRIASVYHLSPWHHPLAQFPKECIYLAPSAWGADLKCVYGPTCVAVMAVTTGISHLLAPGDMTLGSLLLNIALLRLANTAAFLAAALAIWKIQGLCWPRQQRLVMAAFLLNPLVVWESVGALHNDVWGVAFLLWACYLFLRNDARFVAPLALSILSKYLAFAVTPLLAIYFWRRRDWTRLGWSTLTTAVCLGIAALTGPEYLTSRLAATVHGFGPSPTSMPLTVVSALSLVLPLPDMFGTIMFTTRTMTLLFVLIYLALIWRTRTREQVIHHSLWALGLYLGTVYLQTMQWYFVWPIGLLCATRWCRASANLTWASWAVLLGYVLNFGAHNRWSPQVQVLAFCLALGLPVLVAAAGRSHLCAVCPLPEELSAEDAPTPRSRPMSRTGGGITATLE